MRAVRTFLIASFLLIGATPGFTADVDWSKVDQALTRRGINQPGDVYKYGLPRTDLHVTVDGVAINPTLALGSWLAFKPMGEGTMMMGDLVLTMNEVGPVMTKLLASGVTITALHNHLLRAEPFPMYMHIAGEGDPAKLAEAVRTALQASATPFGSEQPTAAAKPDLDTVSLDRILGHKGHAAGGVYQYALPRAETITEGGMPVPPAMGTATSINFQPLNDSRAAMTGDLVLISQEVPNVLRTLREHGIEITAVHNHMLSEQPRLVFVHFWAVDNAEELARRIGAALSLMRLATPA